MNIELLLEDFCYYSQYMRGVSLNTTKRYRQKIGAFSRSLEITSIDDLDQKKVQSFFLKGRVEKNWTTATYRTYYMTLIVFFRWCISQGHLEKNYCDEIELPKMEKSLPKRLSKKDALKLLEVVYNYPYTQKYQRDRNHAMFSTFLFTGLRKSELLNLTLSDVDMENRTIFVRRGKGNKDRIVPMGHSLTQSLHRYLVERKKWKKTCPEFFTCSNRNKGLSDTGLKLLIQKIRKASGVYFTSHRLRHTYATMMIEGGCDIFSLSKMMGHSDIKTTTIYLSTTAEHLRHQISKHPLNNII